MIIDRKEKPRSDSSSSDGSHERYDYGDRGSVAPPPSYHSGAPQNGPYGAPPPGRYGDPQGPYNTGSYGPPPGPPPGPSAGPSAFGPTDVGSNSSTEANPTNGVVINNRYGNINGTWYIDPLLPAQQQSLISSFLTMRAEHGRRGRRHRDRTGGTTAPSVTLNAHHGNVNASFAIVGPPNPARAGIKVATDHGDVRLDLFGKAPAKSVEFDISSQNGHVIVFVPRSFSGVLELSTRRGRIQTMPSLAGAAQVVRSSRDEVVLLVGQASQMSMGMGMGMGAGMGMGMGMASDHGKFYTRSGNIFVGFSGEDDGHAPAAPQGVMQQVLQRIVR